MKKLLSLSGVSSLALLLAAFPAMAAQVDVSGENKTTGPNSENENEYDVDNDSTQSFTNVGNVTNAGSVNANTGGNEQSENTTGGDLESGNVQGGTDWETVVNAAAAMAGMNADLDVEGDFSNDTTGPNSENENDLDVDNDQSLTLTNVATVLNSLGLTANTGDNEQTENTTAGDLSSGNVVVDAEVGTWANNGSVAHIGGSSTSVDVNGRNHLTGPNSENENEFDIDNDATTSVTNVSNVNTSVGVNAVTGGNTQSQNTKGGDVQSGNVRVSTDVQTRTNAGTQLGGSHNVDVNADFTNDTTGPNSENENDLDVDNDSSTTVNNNATVNNSASVTANTGDNEQSQNTTGGDVETGNVEFNFNASTQVN